MGKVYYFKGHSSNVISLDALKYYIGFQKIAPEPLELCDSVDSQGYSFTTPYRTQSNLDYLQIDIVKFNFQRNRDILVSTFCGLVKKNISQLIHRRFGHFFITQIIRMARKGIMKGLPTKLP